MVNLQELIGNVNYQKLIELKNPELEQFIENYVTLMQPSTVFIANDTKEDIDYVRKAALLKGEEQLLDLEGHTVHYDGYFDQARDKQNTKFLLPPNKELGEDFNSMDKEQGLSEINSLIKGISKGKELFVRFFCLGPVNSEFSQLCVQLTDSAYVAHSEDLLYRQGYEEFKRRPGLSFFRFVHSTGELDEKGNSKNIDKRRIYINLEDDIIFSLNTEYGGNTIGMKKPAMRLAINKAAKEGWLTEHMFVMGVHGPKSRITYFTGAFPSMCGKTSTSMLPWESIVGDDIAYIREKDNKAYAVNVEAGMFGIVMGVNQVDDPIIWDVLHEPGELIFSNILKGEDNKPYWIGMGQDAPKTGYNHSGKWFEGKKDKAGKKIPLSHKNARITLNLNRLKNVDPMLHNPDGVPLGGVIYGGRDSDTWNPVVQAFNWTHGIIAKGAIIESETTAAALGQEGIKKFNPMSILDFLSTSIGEHVENNLKFGEKLKNPPLIFGVNYFLKDESGNFLNGRQDKGVWLKWMELRIHDEAKAIKTPVGYIPEYNDLASIFKTLLNKDYSIDEYNQQFALRVQKNIDKIDRMKQIYKNRAKGTPKIVFKILEQEKQRLTEAQAKFGNYILPEQFKS